MSARRGVWLFLLFLGIIGMAVLVAAIVLRSPSSSIPSSAVLVFDVPAEIEESETPTQSFPFGLSRRNRAIVYELVDGIEAAADDSRISALVLHIDGVDWGWAKLDEVRDAILTFRASGKPVFASLSGGGEPEYYLASAANRIAAPPSAILQIDGLVASAMFFRGSFDKLEISPNFAHAGQYKTGVEPYTRTGLSPEGKLALESLLDDQFERLVDSLAAARGLSSDSVLAIVDGGPYRARRALAIGLIDTLLYDADVDSLAMRSGSHRRSSVDLYDYITQLSGPSGGTHIALVTASGVISGGKSRYSASDGVILGSETISEALRQVRARRAIKAVVLRIDSPGGELQASDDIWREVARLQETKPVVVSMSDYAASGGYYMAAPADLIVAQPGTITGSIGVYGGKLNVLGLYRKLGLNVESVSRGKHAGMMSPFRDFTEEEAIRFRSDMEDGYRMFLDRVAEGRGVTVEEADSVGQGRVWSGRTAATLALVDTLGGFGVAFELARELAKIPENEEVMVDLYPKVQHPLFQRILDRWLSFEDQESRILSELSFPVPVRSWITAMQLASGAALAMMPYAIRIR